MVVIECGDEVREDESERWALEQGAATCRDKK